MRTITVTFRSERDDAGFGDAIERLIRAVINQGYIHISDPELGQSTHEWESKKVRPELLKVVGLRDYTLGDHGP